MRIMAHIQMCSATLSATLSTQRVLQMLTSRGGFRSASNNFFFEKWYCPAAAGAGGLSYCRPHCAVASAAAAAAALSAFTFF